MPANMLVEELMAQTMMESLWKRKKVVFTAVAVNGWGPLNMQSNLSQTSPRRLLRGCVHPTMQCEAPSKQIAALQAVLGMVFNMASEKKVKFTICG